MVLLTNYRYCLFINLFVLNSNKVYDIVYLKVSFEDGWIFFLNSIVETVFEVYIKLWESHLYCKIIDERRWKHFKIWEQEERLINQLLKKKISTRSVWLDIIIFLRIKDSSLCAVSYQSEKKKIDLCLFCFQLSIVFNCSK